NAVVENFRDVKISWLTALGNNNKGFEVERNLNGSVWKKVGWITGNGNVTNQSVYSYTDKKLDIGTYYYRLKQIDYNGNFEYFQVNETILINSPGLFNISQNYPNPSNPVSTIEYQIPEVSKVSLNLYDVKGSKVKELVNQNQEPGYYSIKFDGNSLASGVYFYTIVVQAPRISYTETKKMLLIK
ncbi:MAG: T9SS type A sorting domain-containing protein, partial [Ignavibacteria bacterium]|nr:T9SS type A sorting domain-containing protein [Ignavibacteria bacterium]